MTSSEKYCWGCKQRLDFNEFKEVNQTLFTKNKLIELWDHPSLQFFCCNCYTKLVRRDVKKILSDLNEYSHALKSNFNPTVWRRLAIICYDKGDYKKTEEAYKRVLELDPTDLNSAKNLRRLYRKLRKK
jgi:tetratricopeptide (TPR) repeat protein